MTRVFTKLDDIVAAIGEPLGAREWLRIEQDRVDEFARATGDHQWIHVDVERAADGPFGVTIAHGYLTLSLIPMLGAEIFLFDTGRPMLNYGVNKVRFPNPVRVGSRVRATASVAGVQEVAAGAQLTLSFVIEIEGEAKPACVAETVILLL
jgi:acyl dehydratase